VDLERIVGDRLTQIVLQSEPVERAGVHVGIKQLVPRLAARLGVIHRGVRIVQDFFGIGVLDSAAGNAPAELKKLGGARAILATAPNATAISVLLDGLSPNGKLVVPAAPNEPLTVSAAALISGRRSVAGTYSGTAKDAEDTLAFSVLAGVRPMIEKYPLSRVADAYEQMNSGKARFRAVLTMGE